MHKTNICILVYEQSNPNQNSNPQIKTKSKTKTKQKQQKIQQNLPPDGDRRPRRGGRDTWQQVCKQITTNLLQIIKHQQHPSIVHFEIRLFVFGSIFIF
jgi:hypothetical protein